MNLPTSEQYQQANKHLVLAAHEAYAACIPSGFTGGREVFARGCIVSVKLAAKALGYELVEVIPKTDPSGGRFG